MGAVERQENSQVFFDEKLGPVGAVFCSTAMLHRGKRARDRNAAIFRRGHWGQR